MAARVFRSFTVRVPADMYDEFDLAARVAGMSMSAAWREAVDAWLTAKANDEQFRAQAVEMRQRQEQLLEKRRR